MGISLFYTQWLIDSLLNYSIDLLCSFIHYLHCVVIYSHLSNTEHSGCLRGFRNPHYRDGTPSEHYWFCTDCLSLFYCIYHELCHLNDVGGPPFFLRGGGPHDGGRGYQRSICYSNNLGFSYLKQNFAENFFLKITFYIARFATGSVLKREMKWMRESSMWGIGIIICGKIRKLVSLNKFPLLISTFPYFPEFREWLGRKDSLTMSSACVLVPACVQRLLSALRKGNTLEAGSASISSSRKDRKDWLVVTGS